jgi:hypothetical protein
VISRTSGINFVSLLHSCFDLFIVLAQVCSCLEFDLTLGVISSDLVATSCSPYFYMFYNVLLAIYKLIGS